MKVNVAVQVEKCLENIKHLCHLSEDEHTMASRFQLAQQLGKHLQFAAVVLHKHFVGESIALCAMRWGERDDARTQFRLLGRHELGALPRFAIRGCSACAKALRWPSCTAE